MKQFKMIFPKEQALAFATFAYTNEIRVMLSWLQESDFFSLSNNSGGLVAICVASDEKVALLATSEWNKFIQK